MLETKRVSVLEIFMILFLLMAYSFIEAKGGPGMIQLVQAGQDRSQLVAKVLADLPEWFGLPDSTQECLTRPATDLLSSRRASPPRNVASLSGNSLHGRPQGPSGPD